MKVSQGLRKLDEKNTKFKKFRLLQYYNTHFDLVPLNFDLP